MCVRAQSPPGLELVLCALRAVVKRGPQKMSNQAVSYAVRFRGSDLCFRSKKRMTLPLLMQSETRIEKAGFRSVIFPTGLRIATLLIVRRIEYAVVVFLLEIKRRSM